MTDEWEFRTARGRGSVADGKLRVENSLVGIARGQWAERERWSRLAFLFTTVTTIWGFRWVVDAGRTAMSGTVSTGEAIVLGVGAFSALVLLRGVRRTRTVPLRRVRAVHRTDDERIRVTYAERDDADRDLADFEIETLTPADADDAVEMLQLKGVELETGRGPKPKARTFRERLAKKVE